jgi:protein CMS1
MEISDLLPSESSLLPPADFPVGDEPEGSFAPVQRRIEAILQSGPKLKVAAPRVIVLALSGLRCADVVRGVRDVKGNGQVAKVSTIAPVLRWLLVDIFQSNSADLN